MDLSGQCYIKAHAVDWFDLFMISSCSFTVRMVRFRESQSDYIMVVQLVDYSHLALDVA